MKILASDNIPFVVEAFSDFGDVNVKPGRQITPADLESVDVFLARSTTRINEALLRNSPVKFVATATAGTDHVDIDYLERRGICFASAPGCNAESVAEYVTAAILHIAQKYNLKLEYMTLGIVGYGHTGRAVRDKAKALGLKCVLNDPPLDYAGRLPDGRSIEAIHHCDIVTFHVPLTFQGRDATYKMVRPRFLRKLKRGAILINASRGEIVDERELFRSIKKQELLACVLDVWAGEPSINLELLNRVDIATPHIAGHSYDGKIRGTELIYYAFCDFMKTSWKFSFLSKPEPREPFRIDSADPTPIHTAVHHAYDIMDDDADLRHISDIPEFEREKYFEQLRSGYRRRLGFRCNPIVLDYVHSDKWGRLSDLGFPVRTENYFGTA